MKLLSEILDKKNFKKLVMECGGQRVWVPKYGSNGTHDREYFGIRNRSIICFRKQGMTVKQLAKKFKLSIKSIYVVINRGKYGKKISPPNSAAQGEINQQDGQ